MTCALYVLAEHIHFCQVDSYIVFLDPRTDKYTCLEPEYAKAVKEILIDGVYYDSDIGKISSGMQSKEQSDHDHTFQNIVKDLIERGILTQNTLLNKRSDTKSIGIATKDFHGYEIGCKPKIRLLHIFRFLTTSISTAIILRFLSTENIINLAQYQKNWISRSLAAKNNCDTPDAEEVRNLTEIYKILRSFIFTSHNHCFYDSFSLYRFLSSFHLHPVWVFGVRMGPFQAHCWVQYNNIVLNDTVSHVSFYTPIMAVKKQRTP